MTARWRAVAATAAVGATLAFGPVGWRAASADTASPQRFVLVATDLSGTGHLVASGPVHGVGTDTVISHTENPDGTFTDVDRFDLPGGQVVIHDTYRVELATGDRSCTTHIAVEGTWSIAMGTGAFAGATGGGTFTAHGVFVAGRAASGDCLGLDSPPVAFTQVVRGVGTASLP